MKKKTKILATIGPACESEEQIEKMLKAGVDVFRFNFKHNTVEWHNDMIERVNKVAKKIGRRVGTLIDLQGPEIRINMPVEEMDLSQGEEILLSEEVFEKDVKGFSITHPEIIAYLEDGQRVVADDGEFEFSIKVKGEKRYLISKSDGVLKQRKTLNVPGAEFPFPVLIERDFDGIELAKRQEIDFVALSFVRTAQDVEVLRNEMTKRKVNAQIVSKIETEKALNDIEAIIDASDGVMVARGDLGVEMPLEQVPYHQKVIIKKCIEKGKFAITATQMLQSMIQAPLPTRAEVSDVANATYDLSDAVMLSGESASGKYPLRAVETMRKTIEFNESKFLIDSRTRFNYAFDSSDSMIAESAYDLYLESLRRGQSIKAFVVFTHTGKTARLLSAYRPLVPIYAFCPSVQVADGLSLNYAIHTVLQTNKYENNEQVNHNHVLKGIERLSKDKYLKKSEQIIVIHGDYWNVKGGSSTIKLLDV